jgi:hypothetical protein
MFLAPHFVLSRQICLLTVTDANTPHERQRQFEIKLTRFQDYSINIPFCTDSNIYSMQW